MEQLLEHLIKDLPNLFLFLVIAGTLYTVGKGADILVEEAVDLSKKWGVPKVLIGATIVSLGTTLPEAVVSVLAAVKGLPDLALGNAVGSIICDTGLILGIAAIISPLPLNREMVNRQGWLQFGAGCLLVVGCLPLSSLETIFEKGGQLPQSFGFIFLILLAVYLWFTIRWSSGPSTETDEMEVDHGSNSILALIKLVFGIALVVISSWVLIPAVLEVAERVHVPESIIAATLVAFGTSLPELVTAVTAARKGHGELAIGNVIGADILNVLFVAGASAAITNGGLTAPPHFFRLLFPAMLFVLLVFRIGIFVSGTAFKRPFGFVLVSAYIIVTVLSYVAM
ncbi:TPA: calcium/sodium antiporter [Candidatus Poribacteria bacterium]|jgi:cation:H+ antiporter|nr:calcium/sodium antiporter [Candidatus Poribacteria bacterium]HIA69008.1 calcium/sodium antiporter [Candidatus Poribacteria bacterium]HIB87360.1 calcium/sodium antiporter [Candidatus Poribacteria bacterium]HIB98324.1 calcium/sodium antiporter [Candidatus Poribacteria bacterium]HIN29058.1 calcium/sodium antiporter [Candidatus Poribacteria bacterium]